MTGSSNKSKRNLILVVLVFFAMIACLMIRVGWIAIVDGEKYSEMALERQTRDNVLEAERGIIYDTNGNELAVSVTCSSIYSAITRCRSINSAT